MAQLFFKEIVRLQGLPHSLTSDKDVNLLAIFGVSNGTTYTPTFV